MSRLLLDTHTFIWFILGDSQLRESARALIEDEQNERFLSVASIWEMAIKVSIGKLEIVKPLNAFLPAQLESNDITLLSITLPHVLHLSTMPFHHRDPFDRLLIAQGLVEEMPIISVDTIFDDYGVKRL